MAENGLKNIAFAYKDMDLAEVEELNQRLKQIIEIDEAGEEFEDKADDDSKDVREQLEQGLNYIGTFGLADNIRIENVR